MSVRPIRWERFFDALPVLFESPIQWIGHFKTALTELVPDVDKIVVSALTSPLMMLKRDAPTVAYLVRTGGYSDHCLRVDSGPVYDVSGNDNPLRILRHCARQLDITLYRTPIVLEMTEAGRYHGSIVLFQRRDSPPISTESLELLDEMKPFLAWALCGAAFRKARLSPGSHVRMALTSRLQNLLRLTDVDVSVLALLLSGFSYKATAEKLEMTMDAVKKHIKKIYNRAGVNSLSELWTRYYPRRWDGLDDADGMDGRVAEVPNGGTQRRTGEPHAQ